MSEFSITRRRKADQNFGGGWLQIISGVIVKMPPVKGSSLKVIVIAGPGPNPISKCVPANVLNNSQVELLPIGQEVSSLNCLLLLCQVSKLARRYLGHWKIISIFDCHLSLHCVPWRHVKVILRLFWLLHY